MKKEISTPKAPAAVGPYSQAILANGFLFCSGQIPLNPKTGKIEAESIEDQTKQVLENLKAVLEEANMTFENAVKCEVFLADINDFKAVNEIYSTYFTADPKPARFAFEVANLPLGAKVEISLTAAK